MGGANSTEINKEEIEACTQLTSQYTSSKSSVKKILKKLKGGAPNEAKTPEELLLMLKALNYFDTLFKDLKKKKKEYCKSVNEHILREALEDESYQIEVAKMFFKLFDRDHNGVISLTEFVSGYVGYTSGSESDKQAMLFDLWDLDGNGTLSREEISSMWKTNCECQLAFRKVTLSASIVASINSKFETKVSNTPENKAKAQARLSLFMREISAVISESFDQIFFNYLLNENTIVDKIFELADTNNDGVLSRDEFITYSINEAKQEQMHSYLTELSKDINLKMLQAVQEVGNRMKELYNASQ